MLEKVKAIALRYEDVEAQLADPAIYGDPDKLRTLNRERKELEPVARAWKAWCRAESDRAGAEEMLADPELREAAREELTAAQAELERLREELRILLLPRDPDDGRGAILEVRSGVGGEEAALFAGELCRMYDMYARRRGWKLEVVNRNETELGGVRECSILIEGEDVWSRMKFESGVHQVKRVPVTESGGRIHTSTATVAVLPEAEEADVTIDPKDLQIDTYRSSGAGGQHVNKTESAIRITHLPTGLVVECQDERSQYKNRDKAMKVLRSRLYDLERQKQAQATAAERRSQVGSGARSEKIRTYRFFQGQVVEHRLGGEEKYFNLKAILDGDLDELIDALVTAHRAEQLERGAGAE